MAIKKKSEELKQEMNVTIKRAKEFQSGDIGFDMEVNGITIYGCVYKNTDKGNFVSFPAKKNEKDGKYYNHVYFKIDDELLKEIEDKLSELL